MGDTLKKVQSGEKLRIPAAAYNAFIDTARAERQRQQGREQQPQAEVRDTTIVLVKNSIGADRARFEVLGVSDVVIKPADNLDQFKNKVALVGVTPLEASHLGRFVVLTEPLVVNAIGLAVAAGVCPVQLDVNADTDLFADVKDNDAGKLKTGGSGAAVILWKESGTGQKWAVIRLGAGGGALPSPQYQYMIGQGIIGNKLGFDWFRGSPAV